MRATKDPPNLAIGKFEMILHTVQFASRNTTSMGYRIPNVWIDLQGEINRP
jgi:hypothetical protein